MGNIVDIIKDHSVATVIGATFAGAAHLATAAMFPENPVDIEYAAGVGIGFAQGTTSGRQVYSSLRTLRGFEAGSTALGQ